jgi:hypothetical protein
MMEYIIQEEGIWRYEFIRLIWTKT